jgi:hypothetical protein
METVGGDGITSLLVNVTLAGVFVPELTMIGPDSFCKYAPEFAVKTVRCKLTRTGGAFPVASEIWSKPKYDPPDAGGFVAIVTVEGSEVPLVDPARENQEPPWTIAAFHEVISESPESRIVRLRCCGLEPCRVAKFRPLRSVPNRGRAVTSNVMGTRTSPAADSSRIESL